MTRPFGYVCTVVWYVTRPCRSLWPSHLALCTAAALVSNPAFAVGVSRSLAAHEMMLNVPIASAPATAVAQRVRRCGISERCFMTPPVDPSSYGPQPRCWPFKVLPSLPVFMTRHCVDRNNVGALMFDQDHATPGIETYGARAAVRPDLDAPVDQFVLIATFRLAPQCLHVVGRHADSRFR